jgi:uncharacterized protein YqjF (DUF2071 family)
MHSPIKTEGCAVQVCGRSQSHSEAARKRLLSLPREPLFIADWQRTLMIHYEVDPAALQQIVPFQLDLRDGRAFVSLVAFTLSGMRPRFGSQVSAWLLKPISRHDFLNVRTYVREKQESGIYFLAEWLSNRLSAALGPRVFGLPYRFGIIDYDHRYDANSHIGLPLPCPLKGRVINPRTGDAFTYRALLNSEPEFCECDAGSLSEWLMERYTAFTKIGNKRRFFRVWHQPWPQAPVQVCVIEKTLLDENWPLFRDARMVGANFSPGVTSVWMGWPHAA